MKKLRDTKKTDYRNSGWNQWWHIW